MNYVIMQLLRGWFRGNRDWVKLCAPIMFAINTAWSRSRGVSPFEVCYGTKPRLLLHGVMFNQKIMATEEEEFGNDGVFDLTMKKMSVLHRIWEMIREIQEREYNLRRKEWAERAVGCVDFEVGDFVLVAVGRENKFDSIWHGPEQIISRDEEFPFIYGVRNLETEHERRVHVNRLRLFVNPGWTTEVLKAEAANINEFYIEQVMNHQVLPSGEVQFRVKWIGFPDEGDEAEDSWVRWANCSRCSAVKEYIKGKELKLDAKGRMKVP